LSVEELAAEAVEATPTRARGGSARSWWIVPLIVAVAGLGLILAGVLLLKPGGAASAAVAAAPITGHKLADFALTDLAGKQVRLSDYAGRPVLINAWATWCPPCQAEMPGLQQLYQRHEAEGFAILAIDAGEAKPTVEQFIQKNLYTFPVLLDPQTDLLDKWAIRDYPTSIVIGRDGTVKLVQVGALTADTINKVVEPLISE
jgi:thiol-disulfide isomerase/thioredoxin